MAGARGARRRRRRLVGKAAALLAAVVAVTGLCAWAAATPGAVPELDRPATVADRLPGDQLAGAVFPGTARLAGTVGDADVFLAVGPGGFTYHGGWAREPVGVEFCLVTVEPSGMGASCGPLPLGFETSGVEIQLIGAGAKVPEGFERLSESVVVRD